MLFDYQLTTGNLKISKLCYGYGPSQNENVELSLGP